MIMCKKYHSRCWLAIRQQIDVAALLLNETLEAKPMNQLMQHNLSIKFKMWKEMSDDLIDIISKWDKF